MLGSRPGERRDVRQKGTPNKKTAYMRAVMVALSAGPKVTPMDLMLAVMRDPHVALDMRVKMALKALPHLHRKLRAGESASVDGRRSDNQSMKPPRQRAMALHQSTARNRVTSLGQPEHQPEC